LALIRRVCQAFWIAEHSGAENNLSGNIPFGTEGVALENRTVFKKKFYGWFFDSRVTRTIFFI